MNNSFERAAGLPRFMRLAREGSGDHGSGAEGAPEPGPSYSRLAALVLAALGLDVAAWEALTVQARRIRLAHYVADRLAADYEAIAAQVSHWPAAELLDRAGARLGIAVPMEAHPEDVTPSGGSGGAAPRAPRAPRVVSTASPTLSARTVDAVAKMAGAQPQPPKVDDLGFRGGAGPQPSTTRSSGGGVLLLLALGALALSAKRR